MVKYWLYGFGVAVLFLAFYRELHVADALICMTIALVTGGYFALELYLTSKGPLKTIQTDEEMKKDVEDLKSKVTQMTLKDGFKLR